MKQILPIYVLQRQSTDNVVSGSGWDRVTFDLDEAKNQRTWFFTLEKNFIEKFAKKQEKVVDSVLTRKHE